MLKKLNSSPLKGRKPINEAAAPTPMIDESRIDPHEAQPTPINPKNSPAIPVPLDF